MNKYPASENVQTPISRASKSILLGTWEVFEKAFWGFIVFFIIYNLIGIASQPPNILYFKDPAIHISKELNNKLNDKWTEFNGNEFLVCLIERNGTYVDMWEPEILLSNSTEVKTSELCPENATIELHSHPNGNIFLSGHDKQSIINYTKEGYQPQVGVYGIMHSKSHFALYDLNDTKIPRIIKFIPEYSRFLD